MPAVDIILQGQEMASPAIEAVRGFLEGLKGEAEETGGILGNLGGILQSGLAVGLGVAAAGVAAAGVAAGAAVASWKSLKEANDELIDKLGASGPALAQMDEGIKQIYNSSAGLGKSMGDIGNVMGQVAQITHATGASLNTITSQFLLLQKAEGDSAGSTEAFARAMQGWNVPAAQMGAELDKEYGAFQKFGIGAGEMNDALIKFGGTLREAGLSLDQTEGLLAGMYGAGLNGEKAMMALSVATAKFAKEGVNMKEGLEGAIASIKNAESESAAASIAVATFGGKAGPQLAEAIRAGKLSLDGLQAALGDTTGSLQKAADATMDFPEKLELMGHKVQTALLPLGQEIADTLGKGLDAIGPAMDSAVSAVAGGAAKIGSAITTISDYLSGDSMAFEEFQSQLEGLFGPGVANALANGVAAIDDVRAAIQSLASGDLSGFSSAIAGAAAAIGYAFGASNEQAAVLNNTFGRLIDTALSFGSAIGVVSAIFDDLASGVPPVEALASALDEGKISTEQLMSVMTPLGGAILEVGQTAATLYGVFSTLGSIVQGTLTSAFQSLGQSAEVALGALPGLLMAILPNINSLANSVGSILISAFANLGQIEQSVFGILPSLTQTAMSVLTAFAGMVTGVLASAFQTLQPLIISVFQGITSIIVSIMPSVQQLASAVGSLLVAAFQAVQTVAVAVFSAIQPYIPALQSAIAQASAVIGSVLVTALQSAASFITGTLVPAINTFASWLASNLPGAISAVAGFIQGSLIPALQFIGDKLNQYVMPALATLGSVLTGSVIPVLGEVASFVGGVLLAAWQTFVNFVQGAMPTMSSVVEGSFQIIGGVIDVASGVIQTFVGVVHGLITGDWAGAWEEAKSGVSKAIDGVKEILHGSVETISGIIVSIMNGIASAITGGKTDAAGAMQSVVDGVSDIIKRFVESAKDSGRRLIESFADGIRSAISSAVSAVQSAVSAVDQYLPHSDAETGPLSTLTASGAAFWETWGRGAQTGAEGALAVVSDGLSAIANAIHTGNATQAMNELASMFRAIVLGFDSETTGIGSNTYKHIKKLVDAISGISGSVGDFIKALNELSDFAKSAVAAVMFTQAGRDGLLWAFEQIAKFTVALAERARDIAGDTITKRVLESLKSLSDGMGAIKAVTDNVVSAVMSIWGAGGGNASESTFTQMLGSSEAQNWIISLTTLIVRWASQVEAAAQAAAGVIPAASANLTNLANGLQSLNTITNSTLSVVMAVWGAGGGNRDDAVFTQLLSSAGAQNWIVALVTGIVTWASQISAAANLAAGTIPPVSASLTNLSSGLQTLNTVVNSTVAVVMAVWSAAGGNPDDAVFAQLLGNAGAQNWIVALVMGIVAWASQISAAANLAAGSVPAASASLSNLANTLQPLQTIVNATVGVVMAVWGASGGNRDEAAFAQLLGSVAGQNRIVAVAAAIIAWSVQIAAAATAAAGTVPAASSSLVNLGNTLQPLITVIQNTISLITTLHGLIGDSAVLTAITGSAAPIFQSLYLYIVTHLIAEAIELAGAANTAATNVPAVSHGLSNLGAALQPLTGVIQNTVSLITTLHGLIGDSAVLTAITGTAAPIFQSLYNYIVSHLIADAIELAGVANEAANGVSAVSSGLQNLANTLQPLQTIISGTTKVLQDLAAWVKSPVELSQGMRDEFSNLATALSSLWADLTSALANIAPPSSTQITGAEAWQKAAGLFGTFTQFADFLKQLKVLANDAVGLAAGGETELNRLTMALTVLWVDVATAFAAFHPSDKSLESVGAWQKAAGLFSTFTQFADFLKQLQVYANDAVGLATGEEAELNRLTMALTILWVDVATAFAAFHPSDASLAAVEAWQKAAGLFGTFTQFADFLAKLKTYANDAVGLASGSETELNRLTMALTILWVDVATAFHAFHPTDESLTSVEAWQKAAGLFNTFTQFADFLSKLKVLANDAIGLSAGSETELKRLTDALTILWVDVATAFHAFHPTDASLESVGAWQKAAGLFSTFTQFADFLGKLKDFANGAIGLAAGSEDELTRLADALKTLWGDLTRALLSTTPPTDDQIKIAEQWNKANAGLTSLSGVMDYLKKLSDWTKSPIQLSQDMQTQLGNLAAALKTLWTDLSNVLRDTAPPSSDELDKMGEWGKAASALSPFSSVMDMLKKLSDWTKEPIAYTSKIKGEVASLIAALQDMAQQFANAASTSGITDVMQKAADDMASTATKAMDSIGKALDLVGKLASGDFLTGQGSLWVNTHTNETASGWQKLEDAIQPIIHSIVGIVQQMSGAVDDLGTIDLSALQTKLGEISTLLDDASALITKAQHVASGGSGAFNVSIHIAVAFDIPDLAPKIDAIVVPDKHLTTVFDIQDLASLVTAISVAAKHISTVFDIPDLAAQIAAIPVPTVHIPVVYDVPPPPDGSGGTIPGRASGGSVASGQAYVVGEQGPELFVPNSSGTIIPHGKGVGGMTVNINLASAVGLNDSLALFKNMNR